MSKANHRRVTGPRTAAGKAISSQNARTHGLTAATLQLSPDDREIRCHLTHWKSGATSPIHRFSHSLEPLSA